MSDLSQTAHADHITTSVVHDFHDFRHLVSSSFVPLNVTSDRPEAFRGRMRSCGVDNVHLTEISATEHVVERTPELIERADRRYYKLSLLLSGTGMLIQDSRQAVLQPGDLAVYDTHRPYSLVFEGDFRTMVVMFPQHLIPLPVEMVGQLTAVRLSGGSGVGNVVVPFLAQLNGNLEQLRGATGTRLAHGALDLVTTLFASELDIERTATDPHHALMQRIRAYIDENLASTDLGPSRIAAEHYISTRHLHGLFREQGTTVSSWIRSRRLERCRRDLLDPVLAHRPVASIAAKWGFVDAAHFSRVFKATFGRSPSEVRAGR
ncbi:helix-turn-helix domain-containing protein [Actinobacteria bacterium YIM 96077]|uniref:AraC family transcriptional regulator n=1 Tax=Phytoactinopolyspora halophila TaxID=1981511 RepID=A0A329QLG6_9ACTN|nr:helix-turn-helix domain-containing protein [Phytoactinopolyspora halophila]AYY12537.1 helix-turn-helix domain-containing protein [Actinobacteria bacterium YIM 96077]RAW12559.1 AraC family transcriptional regulator [Phytoactinopolyspora halophila]